MCYSFRVINIYFRLDQSFKIVFFLATHMLNRIVYWIDVKLDSNNRLNRIVRK